MTLLVRSALKVKGIYVLVIRLQKDAIIKVGSLGEKKFANGLYMYVGSAQNGLEQRIKRHLKKEKRIFWHIDYLLENQAASIEKIFTKQGEKNLECQIAQQISKKGNPIINFGCSDCKCKSHLFKIDDDAFIKKSMNLIDPLLFT
ncbi:MAG: GIY-YIG nuclease family protein [Crenarchaeota archaeon]|nr:GIY-YIG nuclease family protein [Thermoproteota archaeon]